MEDMEGVDIEIEEEKEEEKIKRKILEKIWKVMKKEEIMEKNK